MAREISYNNFEISLVVFMPNITKNHAITYNNTAKTLDGISCTNVQYYAVSNITFLTFVTYLASKTFAMTIKSAK